MMKFATPISWARDRTPAQWAEHHVRVVILLIALGVLASYPMGVFVLAIMTAPHPQPAAAPPIFKRTEVGDQLSFKLSPQDGVYVITSADSAP